MPSTAWKKKPSSRQASSSPSVSCFLMIRPPRSPPPFSLHDALPIWPAGAPVQAALSDEPVDRGRALAERQVQPSGQPLGRQATLAGVFTLEEGARSEEHTSELQSQSNLVCRLLLGKKNRRRDRLRRLRQCLVF